MAKSVDKITLLLDLKGFKAVKGLGQDFNKFKSTVKLSAREVDKVVKGLTKFHGNTKLSTNALRGQINALTRLKDNVGINTKAYKRLSAALTEAKTKFNQLTGAQKQQGRFGAVGAGGTAALGLAGGFIGQSLGINPAVTALAAAGADASAKFAGKGIMSAAGLKGALIGGGIGLGVAGTGALISSAKEAAVYSSQIRRLEVALKGVTKSQNEFNKAQKVIKSVSKGLNVPIAAATQQFTTLTASVVGAGGSVDEAEKVFRGVSEAIKATGGDAEDVKSAIRAMSQIFGKGKVSAEELQGQLGERLPGAVTKFALATNRTLPQLQKDLRDGTVGLNDVMKFVVKLSEDHSEAAREMAKSSADAGQRMQVTFDELKKNVGDILQPIGAQIQDMTEIAINSLNRFIEAVRKFMKVGEGFELETLERRKKQIEKTLGKRAFTGFGDAAVSSLPIMRELDLLSRINTAFIDKDKKESLLLELKTIEKDMKRIREMNDLVKQLQNPNIGFGNTNLGLSSFSDGGFSNIFGSGSEDQGKVFQDPIDEKTQNSVKKARDILDKYRDTVKDVNSQIANSFVSTFKKLEDSLVEFVQTGTLNFKKLAQSIIADITRIFIRSQIIAPLTGGLGNLFNPKPSLVSSSFLTNLPSSFSAPEGLLDNLPNVQFAKGGIMANNKIVPYAKGGLIDRPTIFPLAAGAALAGEAGVEAIMPLRRGKDGKLGVEATGGGAVNVTVNVDATGSSVEGDEQQGRELGRLISVAIQSELIEQQRPGGLLA